MATVLYLIAIFPEVVYNSVNRQRDLRNDTGGKGYGDVAGSEEHDR